MLTLRRRPGDEFGLGTVAGSQWVASDGRVWDPEPDSDVRVVNRDNGLILEQTKTGTKYQVVIEPFHRTIMVEATRPTLSLNLGTLPIDVAVEEPLIQWTVISLAMVQRVQRLRTWETLVNDMKSLGENLWYISPDDTVDELDPRPLGWDDVSARDAMLRLINTGDTNDREITLSDGKEKVYVHYLKSAETVSKWETSPEAMISRAGPNAGALVRNYLSISIADEVPPEIQGLSDDQVEIDLAALTGPAPHSGVSFIVTAHAIGLAPPYRRRLLAVFDIHVFPSDMQMVARGESEQLRSLAPSAFPMFSSYVMSLPHSHWNDYNTGWRRNDRYAQIGRSISDVIQSFNAVEWTPFVSSLAEDDNMPTVSADFETGALIMELADFGDDPFITALVGASTQSGGYPPHHGDPVNSFGYPDTRSGIIPGWAPRRMVAAGFVMPPSIVGLAIEPRPSEAETTAVHLMRHRIAEIISGTPNFQLERLGLTPLSDLVYNIAEGNDKTVRLADVKPAYERLRTAKNLTFAECFDDNPILRTALRAEEKFSRHPRVQSLIKLGSELLGGLPIERTSHPAVLNARAILDSLHVKSLRMGMLRRKYRGIDDDLTLRGPFVGRVLSSNESLDAADRAFMDNFIKADVVLLDEGDLKFMWEPTEAPPQSTQELDLADLVDNFNARQKTRPPPTTGAGRQRPPPKVLPTFVPTGPGTPKTTTTVAPLTNVIESRKSRFNRTPGWAFLQSSEKNLTAQLLATQLDKLGSYFIVETGLLDTVRNRVATGAADQGLSRFVAGGNWVPLEDLPSGAILPKVLSHIVDLRRNETAGWAFDSKTRPHLTQAIRAASLLTADEKKAASLALAQSDIVDRAEAAPGDLSVSNASYLASPGFASISRMPSGAQTVNVLSLIAKNRALPKLSSSEEANLRTRASALLGTRVAQRMTQDQLQRPELSTLRPLEFSPSGANLAAALTWRAGAAERARLEDQRKQLENKAREDALRAQRMRDMTSHNTAIGFASDIITRLVDEGTDADRTYFLGLKPVPPLENLRVIKALESLSNK